MIWSLANMEDEEGACVTAQIMGAAARLRALCALVGLQKGITPALIKDLKRFTSDTGGLTEQRNRIVHDSWMMGRRTKKVAQLRVTANQKLDYGFRPRTLEELEHFHELVIKHRQRFSVLRQRVN